MKNYKPLLRSYHRRQPPYWNRSIDPSFFIGRLAGLVKELPGEGAAFLPAGPFGTEGTGWQKGGALAWQLFDKTGKPTDEKGRIDRAIPVWGLPTVVATKEGFIIFH